MHLEVVYKIPQCPINRLVQLNVLLAQAEIYLLHFPIDLNGLSFFGVIISFL